MSQNYAMNPSEVKSQGQKLQSNAGEFLSQLNKLKKYNDSLEQIWKGSGSESYFQKWEEKRESVTKLQNWLNGFADATVKSAEVAERTDNEVSGSMK